MGLGHSPRIVTNGLVLCLDAANPRSYPGSGTAWTDLSFGKNNGTLTNGPTYSSANNGSIIFDGVDDYVPISSTTGFPFGSSSGTLCCWGLTNTISGGYSWTISYGTASTSQSRFLGINNSTYYFGSYGNDITASGVVASTWFYMVGVYDGTNASMYINSILVSGPTSKSWNTVSSSAQLGKQTNGIEYWNGKIGLCSVYNRALSAAEISQNFQALRGRYGI